MKIAFVIPFINLTGGIRIILEYANWLHDYGHEVTVVYPSWPYQFHLTRQQQWTEFRNHLRHEHRVPWFDLRCELRRVPTIHAPFLPKAEVVVATSWPTAYDVARLPDSRGAKVQMVFHHEGGTGPEQRIRETYSLPFYRITFSESVRDDLAKRFGCEVQQVVPNGVNTEVFYPGGPVRNESILFLYHPEPRKGAGDGLEALARLRNRVPQLEVRVCGTVMPKELPPRMSFEFHPSDALLRERYATSTAFLYSSRYEGFGLPPLEAMACGCPPVTTAVGAVPEFATDRKDALVVPVGDIEAMVNALEELLRNAPLRRNLSEGGLRTARRFSLSCVGPLFNAALERAVAS